MATSTKPSPTSATCCPKERFSLHFVNNLERECRHDDTRRKLLELAIREWRNPAPREAGPPEQFAVQSLAAPFGRCWNLLPREVARPVLRELADRILEMKSELTLTERPEDPKLASEQEFELFRLIPALQQLEPDVAQSVLAGRPRLTAALKRFPLGMRSVWDGESNYDPARQDVGPAAARYLDRIPEPDLRLFAQIELCAALAGLPQLTGLTTQHRSTCRIVSPAELDQIFGSVLPGIRCPQCEWTPRTKNLWSCNCGNHWNTFDTRGLCPVCGYQWEMTGCLQCGAVSPHEEWYGDD